MTISCESCIHFDLLVHASFLAQVVDSRVDGAQYHHVRYVDVIILVVVVSFSFSVCLSSVPSSYVGSYVRRVVVVSSSSSRSSFPCRSVPTSSRRVSAVAFVVVVVVVVVVVRWALLRRPRRVPRRFGETLFAFLANLPKSRKVSRRVLFSSPFPADNLQVPFKLIR
jgi:hypothetical protein